MVRCELDLGVSLTAASRSWHSMCEDQIRAFKDSDNYQVSLHQVKCDATFGAYIAHTFVVFPLPFCHYYTPALYMFFLAAIINFVFGGG